MKAKTHISETNASAITKRVEELNLFFLFFLVLKNFDIVTVGKDYN